MAGCRGDQRAVRAERGVIDAAQVSPQRDQLAWIADPVHMRVVVPSGRRHRKLVIWADRAAHHLVVHEFRWWAGAVNLVEDVPGACLPDERYAALVGTQHERAVRAELESYGGSDVGLGMVPVKAHQMASRRNVPDSDPVLVVGGRYQLSVGAYRTVGGEAADSGQRMEQPAAAGRPDLRAPVAHHEHHPAAGIK